MNKYILALFSILAGSVCWAISPDVYLASNTATADTLKNICPGQSYMLNGSTITFGNRGVLHGLCNNTGVSQSTIIIYDSSATATVPIANVMLSTAAPCSIYDVGLSSGLTYTKAGIANVTITYSCF